MVGSVISNSSLEVEQRRMRKRWAKKAKPPQSHPVFKRPPRQIDMTFFETRKRFRTVWPRLKSSLGSEGEPGYIYVLRADNGIYKIGRAVNPIWRFENIRTMSPIPIYMHAIYKVEDRQLAEKSVHRMFASRRLHGEWFALTSKDLCRIATRIRRQMQVLKNWRSERSPLKANA